MDTGNGMASFCLMRKTIVNIELGNVEIKHPRYISCILIQRTAYSLPSLKW